MAVTLNGTTGLVFNDGSSQTTAATGFGFKNRIINGQMVLDQRNAGASVTPTASTYTLDRWKIPLAQASKLSIQQNAGSVTTPLGFKNYLGVTSSSAYTVLTGDYFTIDQLIEGFNSADLNWGSANAETVTVSFWVRSSLTGTFSGGVYNSAANRSYVFTYTISAANTWEQKTITIAGDTTGTWIGATNGAGIGLRFNLGGGSTYQTTANTWAAGNYFATSSSVNVVGTSGATFYITGVQLEKGSTATSFDYRPYGTELALCQRYFEKFDNGNGVVRSSTVAFGQYIYKVEKRAAATITISGTSSIYVNNNGDALVTGFASGKSNAIGFQAQFTSSGMTAGYGAYFDLQNGSQTISCSAEL
jgi:hypothetical protein